jgi:hypothetical protein
VTLADGSAAKPGALRLAALCRAGFESDLCAELAELLPGARVQSPQAALVRVDGATRCPRLDELVYARDLIVIDAELPALDAKDRLTPIRSALADAGIDGPVAILAPDADATKPLAPLAEALGRRFAQASGERGGAVWLAASTHALVAGLIEHLRADGFPLAAAAAARLAGLRHGRAAAPGRRADRRVVRPGLVPAGDLQPQAADEKRHAAWQAAKAMLLPALGTHRLRARQLYHDREEITVASWSDEWSARLRRRLSE